MFQPLIDASLRNKLLVALLVVTVFTGGLASYRQLPIDAFPDVSPVLVQVFTVTDGLGPEEVETLVTYPVEAAMSGLPAVEMIRSVSNFGLSVVSVYFEEGTDIYFARQIVSERLSEAREAIPSGFGQPEMGPISSGQGLVLYYNLVDEGGEHSLEALRSLQDWIVKPGLETIAGVTEVLGIGGFVKQYHVNIDPDALLQYGLSLREVIGRIEGNNQNVGGQFIVRNGEMIVVRSAGLARGIEDLENIVVSHEAGTPVFLKEVAAVEIGGEIRQGLETMNGEREVVSGMVVKLHGTNSSTVIEAVEKRLKELQEALPESVRIAPYYEQKTLVENAVRTVTTALLQGVVLVALVLLVFVGSVRASIVVAVAIPFSVLMAVIGMFLFDISANLMSLGGLAIAIGMMVDGAIVMVENTDRQLRQTPAGHSRLAVVSRACGAVARPLSFSILIVIVVFFPLFTLQGVEGRTFRPLAHTLVLGMFGSLAYALVVAPVLAWAFMRGGDGRSQLSGREPWLVRRLTAAYRPLIAFFVRFRLLAVLFALGLLIAGGTIFPRLGTEFTPQLEEGTIIANLSMAPSVSLEETKRNTLLAERRVLRIPEVVSTHARIGRGEVGAHADPVNSVHLMVILKPEAAWRKGVSQATIANEVREALAGMPGVLSNMTQPIQLTVDELVGGSKAELAIKLFGPDLDVLEQKAAEIASVVAEVPGAADVQPGQVTGAPQVVIVPDRERIARYGLNIADVQELVEAAVGGVVAGQIFEGVRRYDIYVRYRAEARDSVDRIRNLTVKTPDGGLIPLGELASVREVVGARQIVREDNQRYVEVQVNAVGRDIGGLVAEAQAAIAAAVELPVGYFISWGGQFELQEEANRRFAIVIPATFGLVALLLYLSLGSLGNTLLILLNIPLALVGGAISLWISGENLSVPASVGFIALFGIALGNGMVLVSRLDERVRQGQDMETACIEGACLRLRPVLMTTLTTALGLLPLLVATGTGSEVQRPLGVVVVGGLATSTVITLLVVPALYKWFAPVPQREDPLLLHDEGD